MRTSDPANLDPVGRLRLPRRGTLLRLCVVAALLLTAAGVLYAGAGQPTRPTAAEPASSPATAGSPAPGDPARASAPEDPAGSLAPEIPARSLAPEAPPGLPPAGAGPGSSTPIEARQPIPPGLVGVPIRLGDPTGLAVLRPGDRVDLIAVAAAGAEVVKLAPAAPVLAVDRGAAALLLALSPARAETVLATPPDHVFAVILR